MADVLLHALRQRREIGTLCGWISAASVNVVPVICTTFQRAEADRPGDAGEGLERFEGLWHREAAPRVQLFDSEHGACH